MKHLKYFFCLPFSLGLFAQCDLPEPYTNPPTGSNLTILLDSGFIAGLNFVNPNPYIVALTSSNLVVGSAYLAPDSLINGMQSVAVWGDDNFTNDVIEGALESDTITLKIVDGIYLYELNTFTALINGSSYQLNNLSYTTNAIIPLISGSMLFVCEGFINGCMDEQACNFDEYATQDDGSCDYPEMFYDCEETCLNDIDLDGVCDELEIVGCFEPMACNYHPSATDEADCIFADMMSCEACSGEIDGTGTIIYYDLNEDGICDSIGCTDPFAMNYSPFAIEDDDSCEYLDQIELKNIEFNVYPNPVNDRMTLVCDKPYSFLELSLRNTLGALVYQESFQNVQANSLIEINAQAFHSGIYFINISSSSALISIPIIKK